MGQHLIPLWPTFVLGLLLGSLLGNCSKLQEVDRSVSGNDGWREAARSSVLKNLLAVGSRVEGATGGLAVSGLRLRRYSSLPLEQERRRSIEEDVRVGELEKSRVYASVRRERWEVRHLYERARAGSFIGSNIYLYRTAQEGVRSLFQSDIDCAAE